MTATLPTQTPPGAPTAPRLDWLDALRGYAALVVVLFHLSPTVIGPGAHMAVFRVIDLGKYGVLLFFLVSGYVIPMSLERHGSLRRFWIGRLFRIYPAYLFAIAFLIACTAAVPAVLRTETVSSVLGHATMLSDPLRGPAFSSYAPEEVGWLLQDLSDVTLEGSKKSLTA